MQQDKWLELQDQSFDTLADWLEWLILQRQAARRRLRAAQQKIDDLKAAEQQELS